LVSKLTDFLGFLSVFSFRPVFRVLDKREIDGIVDDVVVGLVFLGLSARFPVEKRSNALKNRGRPGRLGLRRGRAKKRTSFFCPVAGEKVRFGSENAVCEDKREISDRKPPKKGLRGPKSVKTLETRASGDVAHPRQTRVHITTRFGIMQIMRDERENPAGEKPFRVFWLPSAENKACRRKRRRRELV
jgi:hypothetical protein